MNILKGPLQPRRFLASSDVEEKGLVVCGERKWVPTLELYPTGGKVARLEP